MKNIDIMTFHFAHNYGAVLQAFALKEYLKSLGYNARFVNYVPKSMWYIYSLNPFCEGLHPRLMWGRVKRLGKRISIYNSFDRFIKNDLECKEKPMYDEDSLTRRLKNSKIIIYGSDQIWNDKIVEDIEKYCGENAPDYALKIAYAVSLGTNTLTVKQKEIISRYAVHFESISVREGRSCEILREEGITSVVHVCDPVFLIQQDKWMKMMKKPHQNMQKRYILYYALSDEAELINTTERIAKENELPIYCIHPIANKQSIQGHQLYNVGPKEFLWLIYNAEFVSTNSFHALAFSMIFNKKVLNKCFSKEKCRIWSLLTKCEWDVNYDMMNAEFIDFSKNKEREINEYIELSKEFLRVHLDKCE